MKKILYLLNILMLGTINFMYAQSTPDQNLKAMIIQINDTNFFCRTMGIGEPIIILHGGPGLGQEYLLPYMSQLAENNRIIFYDQRGAGKSIADINEQSMQIEVFIEDLETLRKSLNLKKVSIIGHSWGGFLAMHYAITYPQNVDKLVLMNSMPASSEELKAFIEEWAKRMNPYQADIEALQHSPEFIAGDPTIIENYYRIIFKTYLHNPKNLDDLNIHLEVPAALNSIKISTLAHQTIFSKPFNLHKQLKMLKIPTLIIHGKEDIIPYQTAESLYHSIPHSQYLLIENCGHFPYIEAPEICFQELKIFLQNQ